MSTRKLYRKTPQADKACCPCIKVKESDIAPLERENQERISRRGENIDPGRSHLNFIIEGTNERGELLTAPRYNTSLHDRIHSRIKAVGASIHHDADASKCNDSITGKNTKESVLAEGIIFQLSHELTQKLLSEDGLLDENGILDKGLSSLPKDSKVFMAMEAAYKFASSKYGKDNIAGAYVHCDEYTIHLHIYVVPIVMNGERARLSAKTMFCPKTIKDLWKEFAEAMKSFGAKRAEGLVPKAEYSQETSMDAVREQQKEEIEDLDAEIRKKEIELSRIASPDDIKKHLDVLRETRNKSVSGIISKIINEKVETPRIQTIPNSPIKYKIEVLPATSKPFVLFLSEEGRQMRRDGTPVLDDNGNPKGAPQISNFLKALNVPPLPEDEGIDEDIEKVKKERLEILRKKIAKESQTKGMRR